MAQELRRATADQQQRGACYGTSSTPDQAIEACTWLIAADGGAPGRIPPRLVSRGQGSGSYGTEVADIARDVLSIEAPIQWAMDGIRQVEAETGPQGLS